jgi:hypothetical protein
MSCDKQSWCPQPEEHPRLVDVVCTAGVGKDGCLAVMNQGLLAEVSA